jgi:hypothetical protein
VINIGNCASEAQRLKEASAACRDAASIFQATVRRC